MPSDQPFPPGHSSKPGKKTVLAPSARPSPEGCPGQAEKMTAGVDSSRKSHHLSSEVEKDSGFSDVSSEYLSTVEQTDTEDQSAASLRYPAKLQRVPQKASRGSSGSTFTGLAPVYIVKNVALKQPLDLSAPTHLLTWSSHPPLNGVPGSPARVLFIQPPLATLKPLLPSRKPAAKKTCLTSQSTYPKIAPHPSRDHLVKAGPEASTTGNNSKNKRFCLEGTWGLPSEPAAPKQGGDKEREPLPTSSDQPAPAAFSLEALSHNATTSSAGSGMANLDQAEVRMISRASKKLGFSSLGKQRRFHNTVEILRKSGLLGITLRTKELIRQNSSTQRDLAELREQAQLLYEAVQSNNAVTWTRLQEVVIRSADYWASKGATSCLSQEQILAAGAVGSSTAVARESPPSSPMNLSLGPDALVDTVLP
ncbi:CLOCK-interacting pacemaker isoform X3 [Sphaerodactylus townsendi]|uniref:Uncharacterized protein n=2 Tax=Sphaerodactylus townsendi TaxID=933632 RepID=A0ACB8FSN8_9SAUR|nr:CLOCK-interacting pacemaker isoform X3 [Sphaerodactylus townsendi]